MDDLDKKLYHDLKLEIEVPNECETVIKECLRRKMHLHSLPKIAVTACACLALTVGIVYAGTKVYDKIWKEPEKTVGFYAEENSNKNITKEEKDTVMLKEQAIKRASELLKKMGHDNEKIKLIELISNSDNYELVWSITTDKNTKILLEAKNGDSISLSFDEVYNKNIQEYRTTKEEAEKTARNLCKRYGYDLSNYNYIKIIPNISSEKEAYIWNVSFFKQYNGLVNPYEKITISFVPEINEICYFIVSNAKYENNAVEISKSEAEEIILKEEQKINTGYKIKDKNIELGIVATNGSAYLRTTDYKQYCEQGYANYPIEKIVNYRTERRIRKSWIVTVNYDIPEDIKKSDNSFNPNLESYSYFVDATTGEIIGGDGNYAVTKKLMYE